MTSEEAQLSRYIDTLGLGRVVSLERQPRWRKAWFAEVEHGGRRTRLYIRGDKQLDAEPYPGLRREAAIIQALEAGGVRVPHVHGVCPEPLAIVMDCSPGVRDISQAASDDERRRIAEQYIEQLALAHSLDTAPFEAAGIAKHGDGRRNVLAYVDANQPLYERGKTQPQPLVEFAQRWVRRNAPANRTRARFIVADTGQFLFADGELTVIHDFEASHIGDPLADLASLRTRDGFEPLGADVSHLIRHYAKVTGEAIDPWAISFHTAAFCLTSVMALSGPLSRPDAQPLELEYLIWDLMTRRALLWAMAECLGVRITTSPEPAEQPGRLARVHAVLGQAVGRLTEASTLGPHQRDSANTLARWAAEVERAGPALAARERERLAPFLDVVPADWREADAAMERFVREAGPEQDVALLMHFARQVEDEIALASPVRHRLVGYALKPVQL